MKRALIGHTGFVGSNLKRQGGFSALFNSSNIHDMRGERFDEIVCAGVSAVKWLANKEPENDWNGIRQLLDVLEDVSADRFTLISTIDVYPDASRALDETHVPAPEEGQPYGRHRRAVERFVTERFPSVLIARLPALFGRGLKKNVVFDLLTDNQIEKINPSTVFQWYPLDRLTNDLATARRHGLSLVNLFPEPLATSEVTGELFPRSTVGPAASPAPHYRLRTVHAAAFGGAEHYLMSAGAVMADLARFVENARRDPTGVLG